MAARCDELARDFEEGEESDELQPRRTTPAAGGREAHYARARENDESSARPRRTNYSSSSSWRQVTDRVAGGAPAQDYDDSKTTTGDPSIFRPVASTRGKSED